MIQIIHTPEGQEHPYEQGAEERFPRQPLAGENFTIGIVTRPSGTVKTVRVITRLDDQPAVSVEAVQDVGWRARMEEGVGAEFLERMIRVEQDVWHAELTAPPTGHRLTYWIEADGQRSPDYTLCGESWQEGSADGIEQIADGEIPPIQKIEWLTDGTKAQRVRLTFPAAVQEAFYGLGERFNALNQRGQILDVRCYEQYKSQGKRTYLPIPFLLSSQKYGLFVDSNRWMQFDLAASSSDCWTLEVELGDDSGVRLVWFTDDDPMQIVSKFTLFTGKPALPPQWAFGLWMSGNEWNSQERVMQEVAESKKHEIFPSVLVIEAWSDETTFYIWNDAAYTPVGGSERLHARDFQFGGKWPDPQGMIDSLHADGIRLLLWQIPVLKKNETPHPQQDNDRAYFEQQQLGVRQPDGSLYRVRPFWFRDGYLLDVTNPAARQWWMDKRAYLLEEMGIDGFKTDGGEHLWGADTRFADGRKGDELWNLYPKLYVDMYYQFSIEKKHGDALMFSRAGFVGSQTAPAHWAGDENSTWDAYRHSILAGLSAGLSGILFWGWDIAGFSGETPSAELYLRSTAMAAFCPIMQYHSEYNQHRENRDRTPWNIQNRTGDAQVIPTFRHFVNVRSQLMPYIWQEAQFSAQSGQPMMRALHLYDSHASPYQYYFGRDLLVSPVVEPDVDQWPVYLPEGKWVDFWTKTPYTGGRTYTISAPLDQIPVFWRS